MSSQTEPPLVVISFRKHLVAMDVHTGERAWTFELGLKASAGRLVVEQGQVLFVTSGKLFCLDYATGGLRWTTDLSGVMAGKPRIMCYAGRIVLQAVGEVAGYSLEDGTQLWHDELKGFGIYEGAMAAPGVTTPIDRIQ